MKNVSTLLAAAVVAFNVMAIYNVATYKYESKKEKYNNTLKAAVEYESQDLCEKAIEEYQTLLSLTDTYETRMKIVELYDKGYKSREYVKADDEIDFLIDTIGRYPNEAQAYEKLIEIYFYDNEFQDCADYIELARQSGVKSDYIENAYKTVRKLYDYSSTDFENVVYCPAGSYFLCWYAEKEDSPYYGSNNYTLYDAGGANLVSGHALDMSPVTGDYYFLKEYGYFEDRDGLKEINEETAKLIEEGLKEDSIYEKKVYTSLESCDGTRVVNLSDGLVSETGIGDGLICCKDPKSGKLNYYDATGKEILSGYETAGKFNNGLACVKKSANGEYFDIIGTDGKNRLENVKDIKQNALKECSTNDRMFVKYDDASSYVMVSKVTDRKGERYETIEGFECDDADLFIDGAAAFEKDGKWGFVDTSGKVVIEPQYEEARSFSNGLAAVRIKGKWGFINSDNEIIIEPDFIDAGYFSSEGMCFVNKIQGEPWQRIKMYYWEEKEG